MGEKRKREDADDEQSFDIDRLVQLAAETFARKLKDDPALKRAEKKEPMHLRHELEEKESKPYLMLGRGAAVQGRSDELTSDTRVMSSAVLTKDVEKRIPGPPPKKKKVTTASAKWFGMTTPVVTAKVQQELHLIRNRNYIDPKRHYKRVDKNTGLPQHFQIGRVIDGPADFYTSATSRKMKKKGLVDELLADSSFKKFAKRKYAEVQRASKAGRHSKKTKIHKGTRRRRDGS